MKMDMTEHSISVSNNETKVKQIDAVVKLLNDAVKMQIQMDKLYKEQSALSSQRYANMAKAEDSLKDLYDDNFEFIMNIGSVPDAIRSIKKDISPLINEWLLYLSSMITTSRTIQVDRELYISREYGMKKYRTYSSFHIFNYILGDISWSIKDASKKNFMVIRNGVLFTDVGNIASDKFDLKTITNNVSVDSSKTKYFMELTKKICGFLREGFDLADEEAISIAKDIKNFKAIFSGHNTPDDFDASQQLGKNLVSYNKVSDKINNMKAEIDIVYKKAIKKNHQYRVLLKLKNKKLSFDYGIPKTQ